MASLVTADNHYNVEQHETMKSKSTESTWWNHININWKYVFFNFVNNDNTGYIIFTTIDTNANFVSMPYEVIVKVAITTNFIKLMLDANNLKGPGIELEFYDTTKFENVKGQITHYIALCRENKKSKLFW